MEKEGAAMKHTHKYEPLSHYGVTDEVKVLGIQSAEIRKCRKCGQQMIFVQTKKGDWVPLFEETEYGAQNILMA